MAPSTGVIRIEPDGPPGAGLAPLALDPGDFQSPLPEQRMHLCFEDAARGISVGVRTSTDMQEAFGPYPGDEFMLVLEGRVLMTDGRGGETPVEAGQSFAVRNGVPVSWKQVGPCRKAFVLWHDPGAAPPEIASAEGGVVVLDPAALGARLAPEPEPIGGGTQRDATAFVNDAGTMTVGLWESTPFESAMQPFSVHEFVQMLEGEVTITEEGGAVHRFGRGDVFFVPQGTVCSWKAERPVRKYYAALSPSP